jgi:hypothetical protein
MLASTHHNHQHDTEVCTLNSYSVLIVMVSLLQAETNRNWSLQLQCNNFIYYVQYRYMHSFIPSIGTCRMRRILAVLSSFFHSSLLHPFSCHSSPPPILPSYLTSSCRLFLGLPFGLLHSKFIYNTVLGILFSSILCTCPNQCNWYSLIVSVMVGFLKIA